MWNYKSRINVRDVTIDENRNVMEGDLGVRYRVFCWLIAFHGSALKKNIPATPFNKKYTSNPLRYIMTMNTTCTGHSFIVNLSTYTPGRSSIHSKNRKSLNQYLRWNVRQKWTINRERIELQTGKGLQSNYFFELSFFSRQHFRYSYCIEQQHISCVFHARIDYVVTEVNFVSLEGICNY